MFEPRLHKSGKSILLKLEHREKLVLADTNASMLPVELDEHFCCINIAFAEGMNKSPAAGEKSQQKLRLIFCLNFDSSLEVENLRHKPWQLANASFKVEERHLHLLEGFGEKYPSALNTWSANFTMLNSNQYSIGNPA
nr:hypothetical protein Iba_chr01eCG3340 [Ipomoea batatas]